MNPLTQKRAETGIRDFFLIAQSVRQGVCDDMEVLNLQSVNPCQYHVVEDSTGLTFEQLQHLTFKLCHLYANWTGTVAVPVPIQLARRVCS